MIHNSSSERITSANDEQHLHGVNYENVEQVGIRIRQSVLIWEIHL